MRKARIVNDDHHYHVFVGGRDFWLDAREIIDLYVELSKTEL